jgi:serine/threonine-protein kinase HipA
MLPRNAQTINVHLSGVYVGTLTWAPTQKIIFGFSQDYVEDLKRPTLSLSFGGPGAPLRTNTRPSNIRLPPFFSNLLPEGQLKDYLAWKADVNWSQEFFLLAALRADLPGAVTLGVERMRGVPEYSGSPAEREAPLSFSLAGVQLKLSGNFADKKIVIPSTGSGGHWIVKLPVPGLPRINELEQAMLTLASAVGIETPETRLLALYDVVDIPSDFPQAMDGDCLLSRRFDRDPSGNKRIHIEDFCQVFGIYDKYDTQFNYQSIASVLWNQVGLQAVEEFIRRLVFSIAIGNADMHLKNWSLIYPDQRKPQLSPAYDFIPSAAIYPHTLQHLCLKIAGEWDFYSIGITHFKKLAALAKLPETAIVQTANDTAESIHKVWRELGNDLGLLHNEKRLIDEQIKKSALLHERREIGVLIESTPVPEKTESNSLRFGLDGQIKLNADLSTEEILYESSTGDIFTMPAPTRMIPKLMMEQLHEIMRENSRINGAMFKASVALPRFVEWREENILRIDTKTLEPKLSPGELSKAKLNLKGTFFSNIFTSLEQLWKTHRVDWIDFQFESGELWTAYCSVQDMSDILVLNDGKRTCSFTLLPREAARVIS